MLDAGALAIRASARRNAPDFSLVSNEYSTANHVFRGPRRSVLTPRAGPYHTANEFPPLLVKKQR